MAELCVKIFRKSIFEVIKLKNIRKSILKTITHYIFIIYTLSVSVSCVGHSVSKISGYSPVTMSCHCCASRAPCLYSCTSSSFCLSQLPQQQESTAHTTFEASFNIAISHLHRKIIMTILLLLAEGMTK
jgi:hypothetical protein